MPCICQARQLSEHHPTHSAACEKYNNDILQRQLEERILWETQEHPCTGPGYAHGPHGKCPGRVYDRT